MILGLTLGERKKLFKSIMLDVLGAIETGDAKVLDFDIDLIDRSGDTSEIDMSFTILCSNTVCSIIVEKIWGKHE